METSKGKVYLTLEDIKKYSIWKTSDIDDLSYPVTCADDFPENSFALDIRAIFTTPLGEKFLGYIVGIKNIYCIAIYVKEQVFYFNTNLPRSYPDKLKKISELLGRNITVADISPLKYTTDIDLPGFRNIEGEFDLLRPLTDEEKLEGI